MRQFTHLIYLIEILNNLHLELENLRIQATNYLNLLNVATLLYQVNVIASNSHHLHLCLSSHCLSYYYHELTLEFDFYYIIDPLNFVILFPKSSLSFLFFYLDFFYNLYSNFTLESSKLFLVIKLKN